MWRETWAESDLPRSLHRFLSFLGRFIGHGGRFSWTSIKVVIRQYAIDNGRPYSEIWIRKLLQRAVDAGVIRRAVHSAPGQPAVYEAVILGHPGYRPVTVRRRGITPKRLLASFRRETGVMSRRPGHERPVPGTGTHRLRDQPYPDELDQMFCEEDETLCILPERPCACCWIAIEEMES